MKGLSLIEVELTLCFLLCLPRIEHLEAPVLSQFPAALFGKLNPRIVILSTPNSDFNVLFPTLTGFRHWDHKFEWSRREFQTWYGHFYDLMLAVEP